MELRVVRDQDPMSPRDWDNLGTMACWHRRYKLGDEQPTCSPDVYMSELKETEELALVLPLYLYDHSGITMSVKPFSCPWDSGQVGFVYVTKTKLLKEFGAGSLTDDVLEKGRRVLEAEVVAYDQFLCGDVWGYVLEGEECDSCFGFFGDDLDGMKANLNEKYHELLKEAWDKRLEYV